MNRIIYILGALCLALAAADLFRERHGDFAVESAPLIWCAFGFISYVAIVFAAKALRRLVLRPEDYYGRDSIDAEETEARDA
ncbi:MAG TPA: hypothetical protein VGN05_00735 [Parvibaculum sp.]|jgi:hypothetical protein